MKRKRAIRVLKNLLEHLEKTKLFEEDVQAVEYAIKELEKNAFNEIPTKAIVEKLSKREGVKMDIADPYKDIEVKVNGPAIVLTIID